MHHTRAASLEKYAKISKSHDNVNIGKKIWHHKNFLMETQNWLEEVEGHFNDNTSNSCVSVSKTAVVTFSW